MLNAVAQFTLDIGIQSMLDEGVQFIVEIE